jgi:hypothetical protein
MVGISSQFNEQERRADNPKTLQLMHKKTNRWKTSDWAKWVDDWTGMLHDPSRLQRARDPEAGDLRFECGDQ